MAELTPSVMAILTSTGRTNSPSFTHTRPGRSFGIVVAPFACLFRRPPPPPFFPSDGGASGLGCSVLDDGSSIGLNAARAAGETCDADDGYHRSAAFGTISV